MSEVWSGGPLGLVKFDDDELKAVEFRRLLMVRWWPAFVVC